ncbi:hypothetical protein V8E55_002923 [Tylopilus felleus]
MPRQCTLPTELVYKILCYTDLRDIIRWRTVSKWFRAITQDPALWNAQYENLPFVRSILPPGTFPSQSTDSSERAIIRWPDWHMLSHVERPFLGEPPKYPNNILIAGKWLLVCQLDRRFVLYDTDADAGTHLPHILWEQEERISHWIHGLSSCWSANSTRDGGISLIIGHQDETRYMIDERGGHPTAPMHVLLTNTHVFGFFRIRENEYLIQAFTVSDDQPLAEERNSFLRLSHEGILSQGLPYIVIRDAVVDPITGSINVRFLDHLCGFYHPMCIDVTLHTPSSANVSSMTICSHAVISNKRLRHYSTEYHFFRYGGGHARGLFTERYRYKASGDTPRNESAIVRYTIDATQNHCTFTLGEPFPLPEKWKHFNRMDSSECDPYLLNYDCLGGRLFYVRYDEKQKKQFLVVVEVE